MLAIGCKEISVTLPFFVILYEWYFFQDLSWPWLRRWLPWMLGACVPVAALAIAHFGVHPLAELPTWYENWYFTMSQRVLTEFRVVLYYVSLLFYPHPSRLNLDYDFSLSHSLLDPPTTLLSLCAIVGLLGLAIWLAKRERVLSFCILWFFGNLVIESSVIPLDIVFEHRLYLPSMLVSLVVVAGVYRHVRPKPLAAGLLCFAAVVFSVWTYQRNEVWRDPVAFWSDTVKKSPNKARPRNNLAKALAHQGDYEKAIAQYLESLRIDPGLANVHNNLGNAFFQQGKLGQAIDQYRIALEIEPKIAKPHTNLGLALAQQGNREEAIRHFRRALRIDRHHAKAYNGLGIVRAQQGDREKAIRLFRQALRIQPHDASTLNNLGKALAQQGNQEEAIAYLGEALRIRPDYAEAHYNLAGSLARQGNLIEAKEHYQQAKRLNPNIRIPAMIQ
jgi:tetratricopeptide (TPR) repeat protein